MGLSNAEYILTWGQILSPLHAIHVSESMVFMYLLIYLVLKQLIYSHNLVCRKRVTVSVQFLLLNHDLFKTDLSSLYKEYIF